MASKNSDIPDQIRISKNEADELIQRVKESGLLDNDVKIITGLISFNAWMQARLSRAKLTIKKLRKLFGFTSESSKHIAETKDGEDAAKTIEAEPTSHTIEIPPEKQNTQITSKPPKWNKNKNHGRLAASEYTGCPIIEVDFTDTLLQSGFCRVCAESGDQGKLEYPDPSVLVFLEGSPIVSGKRVQLKRAKCRVCETYFTADLPDEFKDASKYAHTATSAIAIQHYYAGQPFKRIEMMQKAQKVPLPDATQYDLMSFLYKHTVQYVVAELRLQASNGKTFYFDDTIGRIIDQSIQNKKSKSKRDIKSVHATAIISEYEGHRIHMFQTDTQTAGKTFASLIHARESNDGFITMSDASSNNFPDLNESLLSKWVISLCLSHGRRKFHELIDDSGGSDDYKLILKIIGDVYSNERYCKDNHLSDESRLSYHQEHSGPLMRALHTWLNNLLLYKEVEPNSPFGEAIAYLLKRWVYFTQFIRIPGIPLDNNICEIAIKVLIRYRNNSRFYKTAFGASVGDAIMSLVHTAIAANVNPFDYLNALQVHSKQVKENPTQWLPWNYQQTIRALTEENYAPIES